MSSPLSTAFHYDLFKPNHWANLCWLLGPQDQHLFATQKVGFFEPALLLDEMISRRIELESKLNHVMASAPYRLGKYCEQLMSFALDVSRRYELQRSGLQITHNGRTIGELDFIVGTPEGDCVHIEMAVKFYLEVGEANFVGPSLKDSFSKKWTHLKERQIRLPYLSSAKDTLSNLGISIDRSLIFMPMRIFRPASESDKFKDTWICESDFRRLNSHQYFAVPRLCWPGVDHLTKAEDLTDNVLERFSAGRKEPIMIVDQNNNANFLVSDKWYEKALDLRL